MPFKKWTRTEKLALLGIVITLVLGIISLFSSGQPVTQIGDTNVNVGGSFNRVNIGQQTRQFDRLMGVNLEKELISLNAKGFNIFYNNDKDSVQFAESIANYLVAQGWALGEQAIDIEPGLYNTIVFPELDEKRYANILIGPSK